MHGIFFSRVLTNLNLYGNEIGDEGATAIAEALRGNGVLKTLNLSQNQLCGIDFMDEVFTKLHLGENQLCGLDRFGRGTYSAAGITALAEALKVNEAC